MESENLEGTKWLKVQKIWSLTIKNKLASATNFLFGYKDCGLVERQEKKKDAFKASYKNGIGGVCRS